MPRPSLPNLSPTEVVDLVDALLANADALLNAASMLLDASQIALARSLAILGLEESGKAIALHQRRVDIADSPEGDPFVDDRLTALWASHPKKLEAVHSFLADEQYWFGAEPSGPDDEFVLQTIKDWATEKNVLKQRGFYVDVEPQAKAIHSPQDADDADEVQRVLERVHQIGWQLRLGEHIEARRLEDEEERSRPASDEDLELTRKLLTEAGLPSADIDDDLVAMKEGVTYRTVNNRQYLHRHPDPGIGPFANVGKPGYEAQDRQLQQLWRARHEPSDADTDSGADEPGRTDA